MKERIACLVLSLFVLLTFTACPKTSGDPLLRCAFLITLINNSEKTYSFHSAFQDEIIIEGFDTARTGIIRSVEGKSRDGIIHDLNQNKSIDDVEKRIALVNIHDEEGNIVFRACGWPEEWRENAPEGWTIPDEDYDRYEIGWVDRAINGNAEVYYETDSGEVFHDIGTELIVTIEEDGSITSTVTEQH